MPVGDYCERPARTIGPDDTLREAARLMDETNVGCLVLVVDQTPQGIVTDRDLVLEVFCERRDPEAVTVGEVATKLVVTVSEDASLAQASRLMAQHAVRRLPVVDDKDRVVGVITADDVVGIVVEELSGLSSAVQVQSTWREEVEA